ncbi:type II toxin-antitoxin system VapC family toxin [Telmatobacter bradus]|uniref:type II toxin-antitoxin system VapC family toxin n=1 Tax=Telmatobacter bradus TaxID=474953 RepID=UPI003B432086
MSLVLDASMALAWQFARNEEAALAERVLLALPETGAWVPAIWCAEVANALLRGERAGVLTAAQSSYFLEQLAQCRIEVDGVSPLTMQRSVVALARAQGLTTYDASYLELALRMNLRLATFDRKLRDAALTVGVKVVA